MKRPEKALTEEPFTNNRAPDLISVIVWSVSMMIHVLAPDILRRRCRRKILNIKKLKIKIKSCQLRSDRRRATGSNMAGRWSFQVRGAKHKNRFPKLLPGYILRKLFDQRSQALSLYQCYNPPQTPLRAQNPQENLAHIYKWIG